MSTANAATKQYVLLITVTGEQTPKGVGGAAWPNSFQMHNIYSNYMSSFTIWQQPGFTTTPAWAGVIAFV